MLHNNGNAVDAAVAVMIALSVVVPGSVGLGGYGGSAIISLAGGKERRTDNKKRSDGNHIVAVDFDSRAPLGFREGLITADPQSSLYGARSVTVPAVVAGLELILREFGTKSWKEVSQPAIRLAEEGFDVDSEHRRYLDRCAPQFDPLSLKTLFPNGTVPNIGDRWRQPDHARLLHRLVNDGPLSFYQGETAKTIVRFLHDRGGLLTEQDFRSYRPQVVEPVHMACCNLDFYTPPPPSGGITSFGIVQTVEQLDPRRMEPWSGQYFHVLAEATKICWQERHQHLGDPDFVSVPMDDLLSAAAAEARADQIRTCTPCPPLYVPGADSPHTSNVLAIDSEGNLISLTATQGWMYGSHLVVDGLGLVLNHGMSRFDFSQGHPNAPAPGKRMQHNMSPTIALNGARPAFAWGLPGGPKIVNVTAQLILDAIAFDATPAAAIAAPRLHTVGDDSVLVSTHTPTGVVTELEKLGYVIRKEEDMGGPVNVFAIDAQTGRIDVASGEATGAVAGW